MLPMIYLGALAAQTLPPARGLFYPSHSSEPFCLLFQSFYFQPDWKVGRYRGPLASSATTCPLPHSIGIQKTTAHHGRDGRPDSSSTARLYSESTPQQRDKHTVLPRPRPLYTVLTQATQRASLLKKNRSIGHTTQVSQESGTERMFQEILSFHYLLTKRDFPEE